MNIRNCLTLLMFLFAMPMGNAAQPVSLSEEAKGNAQYLAANALKKSKSLLESQGDFAPFGAGLLPNGDVKYVWAVKPGASLEGINPVFVLHAIRRALNVQAASGRILSSAVVYRYRPEDASEDADPQINIEVEYLTGYAEVIATQFEKKNGEVRFMQSAKSPFTPIVFAGEERANTAKAGN